ncbi:virulence factor Mce [Mycobacterium xenopi]|nr:virulence factor Mce [Mycobacterium xenopi]
MNSRVVKIGVAIALVLVLIGGTFVVVRSATGLGRIQVTGYFANSTGLYNGDNVVILGVPVGKVEKIEPQPDHVKISFWYNDKYKVPADAKAVIISPSLVTPRAIQLTPGAIVNICGWRISGGLLPGFLGGRFVGAFEEFAVLELGAGPDEGDQVGCVHRAPA